MKRLLTTCLAIGISTLQVGCKIIDAIIDPAGPLPRLQGASEDELPETT